MGPISPLQVAYLSAFSLAGVACVGVSWRVRNRLDGDVRRGLLSLFLSSALWAGLTVAQFLAGTEQAKVWLFTVGLVVGFGTVGCWLYFVSAYSGSRLHRDRRLQFVAVVGFLVVSAVKLTNGFHGAYFAAELVSDPFPHLSLVRYWPHWVITGLAYVLVGVGFVSLFRTYARSGHDSSRITALAVVTAIPVLPDLVSTLRPDLLLPVTYEPLGVAVFALGSLFVVESDLRDVGTPARTQVVDGLQDAVVVVDGDDVVRDTNPAAANLFEARGKPLAVGDPAPALLSGRDYATDGGPTTLSVDGRTRYYRIQRRRVELGPTRLGYAHVFTDVTASERQRQTLRRQRTEMDNLAEAICHELRNDLNIAAGYADIVDDRLGPDEADTAMVQAIERVVTAHGRMSSVVDDLATLAELGQSADCVEPQSVEGVVERACERLDDHPLRVDAAEAGTVVAEEKRLVALFSNLLEHAATRGARTVTVRQTADERELHVRHDGRPIPREHVDSAFQYGTAATKGIRLANAQALARVHGWSLSLSTTPAGETEIVARTAEHGVDSPASVAPERVEP